MPVFKSLSLTNLDCPVRVHGTQEWCLTKSCRIFSHPFLWINMCLSRQQPILRLTVASPGCPGMRVSSRARWWMHDRSVPTFCQHISEGAQTRDRGGSAMVCRHFCAPTAKMGLSSSCHSYECMQISSDDSDVNALGHE